MFNHLKRLFSNSPHPLVENATTSIENLLNSTLKSISDLLKHMRSVDCSIDLPSTSHWHFHALKLKLARKLLSAANSILTDSSTSTFCGRYLDATFSGCLSCPFHQYTKRSCIEHGSFPNLLSHIFSILKETLDLHEQPRNQEQYNSILNSIAKHIISLLVELSYLPEFRPNTHIFYCKEIKTLHVTPSSVLNDTYPHHPSCKDCPHFQPSPETQRCPHAVVVPFDYHLHLQPHISSVQSLTETTETTSCDEN